MREYKRARRTTTGRERTREPGVQRRGTREQDRAYNDGERGQRDTGVREGCSDAAREREGTRGPRVEGWSTRAREARPIRIELEHEQISKARGQRGHRKAKPVRKESKSTSRSVKNIVSIGV